MPRRGSRVRVPFRALNSESDKLFIKKFIRFFCVKIVLLLAYDKISGIICSKKIVDMPLHLLYIIYVANIATLFLVMMRLGETPVSISNTQVKT